MREKFIYSGETVKVKNGVRWFGGSEFRIEDYWENINGSSWMESYGNPAALEYALRRATQDFETPMDNEVVYGKIGPMGHLFHVSELTFPEAKTT